MTTRAIAYVRVSTDMQATDGVSLQAQRVKVQQYADLYGITIVAVIEDAGVSAKTLDRPGLQQALHMLDAGDADALLIVKLDRLTRSIRDLGSLLDSHFGTKGNKDLLVVQEQVDTRSAAGRLVLNVLMSVAQWEREAIGERTSAAMRHKAQNNEYTGGGVPYGWSLAADGVNLSPCSQEQQAIKYARQLHADGVSLRKIGALLQAKGYGPKSGKKWYPSGIKRVLSARCA